MEIMVSFDSETKDTSIICDDSMFDASRIQGMDISEWSYPFIKNNQRWNGFYEEIKRAYGTEKFKVFFQGQPSDAEILRNALAEMNVEVIGSDNKVVILYNHKQCITKITVNGKVFNTAKLTGYPIEKWVLAIQEDNVTWDGIFRELKNYLGTDSYTIQFVGRQVDMLELMEYSPKGIDITYRIPVKKPNQLTSHIPEAQSKQPVTRTVVPEQHDREVNPSILLPRLQKPLTISQIISDAKSDYSTMNANHPYLSLCGKIAGVLSLGLSIYAAFRPFLLVDRALLYAMLALIPALLFVIVSYKEKYKGLATVTIAACLLVGIISCSIIGIRRHMLMKEFSNALGDISDSFSDNMSDLNDLFDQYNDAMSEFNNLP